MEMSTACIGHRAVRESAVGYWRLNLKPALFQLEFDGCGCCAMQVLCGNMAMVETNNSERQRQPTENADCHISKKGARPTDSLLMQALNSQVS